MYIVPGLDLSLASALKGSCFELIKRNRYEWYDMEDGGNFGKECTTSKVPTATVHNFLLDRYRK